MIKSLLQAVFGSKNERDIKKLLPLVSTVNALSENIAKLSDEALRAKTQEFRHRLSQGEALDQILPEAFAVVREAGQRAIGLRHFDVQLMGGMVLHQGKIAEMRTGEGKTLVATLAAYVNALSGQGVHVVTVNDYLAKRDRQWMGPLYEFLGLTVGYIQHDTSKAERQKSYGCDITYVTNNELGFDYLRDNMVIRKEDRVLRPLHYAIVDEVDSILIDEARTPLIISGPAEESTDRYYIINRLVPNLKGRVITEKEEIEAKYKGLDLGVGYDYIVDEKAHTTTLTEEGIAKCEKLLGIKSLYDDIQGEWVHHITQALRAHNLFHKDVDYVVKDGEVIIVDEFTGRLMPGRRWSDGLHQAVEAKENLRIAEENQTLATITFQNFFRLYKKLSGMTGTALTEAEEFWEIYKLDVVEMPTNRPMIRVDHADVIYRTEREKFDAIVKEIEELWKQGRPMLVGTRSIEKSERLASMLRKKGVPHQVLNAKYHEMEAQIIAQAGKKSSVTIATNMAGRGTDIVLGGNPPDPSEAEFIKSLGGFHVLGTERHEARRIDNQLRGRTGRQGDPGSSRFYLALDDELMRLFGSDRISGLMQRLGMQEGEDIQHPWVTKAIASAQRKVEAMNFDIRKHLIEYDNVMNKQRETVYDIRNDILDGEDVRDQIKDMMQESWEEKWNLWVPEEESRERDLSSLAAWFSRTFNTEFPGNPQEWETLGRHEIEEKLSPLIQEIYDRREKSLEPEMFQQIQRLVLLQVIDAAWKDHLYELDQLKKGIGLRAYGQKDPLIEYQKESFRLFEQMMVRIRDETVEYIFRVEVAQEPVRRPPPPMREVKPDVVLGPSSQTMAPAGAALTAPAPFLEQPTSPSRTATMPEKIGRNDPCPCGSGKKYKRCHGQ